MAPGENTSGKHHLQNISPNKSPIFPGPPSGQVSLPQKKGGAKSQTKISLLGTDPALRRDVAINMKRKNQKARNFREVHCYLVCIYIYCKKLQKVHLH